MMEIISDKLKEDLISGKSIKLNIGSGGRRRDGYYGLDIVPFNDLDILADLNEYMDKLPSDCVSDIYSNHVVEHIDDFVRFMEEIYRISLPGATIEIIAPHFSNPHYYSDPTHVRPFGLYSMHYFVESGLQPGKRKVPAFYSNAQFRIKAIKIEFYNHGLLDTIFAPIFVRLFNVNIEMQNFYERRFSTLYHAAQIRYIIEPVK